MQYCSLADLKKAVQVASDDTEFDAELESCIEDASDLVKTRVEAEGLSLPRYVPSTVANATKYFAAWLFRKRRDPTGAAAFKEEAEEFLKTYINSRNVSEMPFKVVSDQ